MIGYSFVEQQCTADCTVWKGVGLVIGALVASVGVAIVAVAHLAALAKVRVRLVE